MSDRMRMTGMNSGMDTQSIVEQLVKAKSTKKESLVKNQTKLEWKQEAWKNLNTKIYSFYTEQLDALRFEGGFNAKRKATISNSSLASVTAGANAVNGTQNLAVKKLAQTQYITSKSYGDDVKSDTKLSDVFGDDLKLPKLLNVNGKDVQLNGDMTMKDMAKEFAKTGINASFDDATHRLFLSSKESGKAGEFKIMEYDANHKPVESAELMKSLGLSEDSGAGLVSKNLGSAVTKNTKMLNILHNIDLPKNFSVNGQSFEINNNTTVESFLESLKSAVPGLDAHLDTTSHRFVFGSDSEEALKGLMDADPAIKNVLGLSMQDKASVIQAQDAEIELNGAKFTSSSNSFEINGLNINVQEESGYNLIDESLGDVEGNRKYKTTSIAVDTDVDGVYNMVKDFFKKYNELVNEMSKLYNADAAKKYEPLTDEEKEAMSDDEVEKWETKIKDSLLRRDNDLQTVISTMTSGLAQSIKLDNGNTYSLSSFGINTLSYFEAAENEKYAYHIDGDQDDSSTKGKTDLLKSAITSNFDDFRGFMTKLTGNLYSTMNKQMARTEYRSIYHLYDDKAMQSEYDKYKQQISKEEQRISDFEDKWYDKFAQMEKAMTSVNAKQSAISSLLAM
ncbi:MAG: flagellar filament capping protein FliD [Lachnospiraceae bacterium]|nr:flagellar filament capping protein FliD [Lachnospiraceae bacterium]